MSLSGEIVSVLKSLINFQFFNRNWLILLSLLYDESIDNTIKNTLKYALNAMYYTIIII